MPRHFRRPAPAARRRPGRPLVVSRQPARPATGSNVGESLTAWANVGVRQPTALRGWCLLAVLTLILSRSLSRDTAAWTLSRSISPSSPAFCSSRFSTWTTYFGRRPLRWPCSPPSRARMSRGRSGRAGSSVVVLTSFSTPWRPGTMPIWVDIFEAGCRSGRRPQQADFSCQQLSPTASFQRRLCRAFHPVLGMAVVADSVFAASADRRRRYLRRRSVRAVGNHQTHGMPSGSRHRLLAVVDYLRQRSDGIGVGGALLMIFPVPSSALRRSASGPITRATNSADLQVIGRTNLEGLRRSHRT